MTEVGESVSVDTGSKASSCDCTSVGHPVDVATGKVFTVAKDIAFANPFPIGLYRTWSSGRPDKKGIFGLGWTSLLDLNLEVFPDEILYHDDEGRPISFPSVDPGNSYRKSCEDLTIYRARHEITISGKGKNFIFRPHSKGGWRIRSIESDGGASIDIEYDSGSASRIIDAAGIVYRLSYGGDKLLKEIFALRDESQDEIKIRQYRSDSLQRLVEVKDEYGHAVRYEYNDDNLLIKETNRNGYSFHYEYDADGWCVGNRGDNNEFHLRLQYFPTQGKTVVVNERNAKTTYYWNSAGLVTMVVDPCDHVRHFNYDSDLKLIGEIDADHNTVSYEYEDSGAKTTIDQHGARWKTFHGPGIVVKTDPLDNTVIQTFDDRNRLIKEQDEEGNTRRYYYAPDGRRMEGNRVLDEKIYDKWGRLLIKRDATGNEERLLYDLKGRLTKHIDKNGGQTAYRYDPEGQLIQIEDPLCNQTSHRYRGFNKRVETRNANGDAIRFEYHPDGKLAAIVNENGESHSFTYDFSGKLTRDTGFDGLTHCYEYNRTGFPVHIGRSDGSSFKLGYNKKGMPINIKGVDADGTVSRISYEYDIANRLVEARNENCRLRFEYDSLARTVKEYQNDFFIERTYDSEGNLAKLENSFGDEIEYVYDDFHLLSEIILPDGKKIRYARNELGHPVERHLPGGAYSKCAHDAMNNLLSQELKRNGDVLVKREYKYDAKGRVVFVDDSTRGKKTYHYDHNGQLVHVVRSDGKTEIYEYDAAGNILSSGRGDRAKYEKGNRLVSINGTSCRYDHRGNLITKKNSRGFHAYRYNVFNQLIGYEGPDGQALVFQYDPFGRRIKKVAAGDERNYYWDDYKIAGESSNEMEKRYFYYPKSFTPICCYIDAEPFFYHVDCLPAPSIMTDAAGKIVWSGMYETYGYCETGKESEIENPLRFPGQYYDKESELNYNVCRYYDAESGRYITHDPISYLSNEFNLYRYAKNAPTHRTDPTGLEALTAGWGIAIAEPSPFGEIIMGIITVGVGIAGILMASKASESAKSDADTKCDEGTNSSSSNNDDNEGEKEKVKKKRDFKKKLKKLSRRTDDPLSHDEATDLLKEAKKLDVDTRMSPKDLNGEHWLGGKPHIHIDKYHIPVEPKYAPPTGF